MKKLFVSALFLAGTYFAQAQYSLTFCEDVNGEGRAQMSSNSFMVDQDGGVLKFLLKADDRFNTEGMEFRIFLLNDAGKEEEITRMPQKVDNTWNFAWKEVVFFDPGNYKVKVYTAKGTYLTSANLTIKHR
ncbi:MAG: hypothetical protein U0T75_11865 [Chitinophagales bacterium]